MKIVFDSEEQRDMLVEMLAHDDGYCPSNFGLEESEQPRGCILCEVCWRDAIKTISEVKQNGQS